LEVVELVAVALIWVAVVAQEDIEQAVLYLLQQEPNIRLL
jgi:hypothetical protein